MAKSTGGGIKLEVFSGKQAKLNRIIFLVLRCKSVLTSYETYKEIRSIKGFRHVNRQNIDRRMKELHKEGYLEVIGTKPAKAHFQQPLYRLGNSAKAALELSKKDWNLTLKKSPKEELRELIDLLRLLP